MAMTTMQLMTSVPLLAAIALAACIDGRHGRIPNWLTLPLLAAGLVHGFLPGALVTPVGSLLGFLTGFFLIVPLFAIGAMGGGDVKLLAAVGAWLGPQNILAIFLVEAVLGMVIVLIQAAIQGRFKVLARNTAVLAVNLVHINQLGVDHALDAEKKNRTPGRPLPYAVPVLLATLAVIGLKWRGGLL